MQESRQPAATNGPVPPDAGPPRGAVIFDRDGVLNVDTGYAHLPSDFTWIPGAKAAVKAVNDAGLMAFVATQAGVAHGYYGEQHVLDLHAWMGRELEAVGASIDAFVYCPYHPDGAVDRYRPVSDWRKPAPGMLRHILETYPVDPARTVMIGDKVASPHQVVRVER